TTVEQKPISDSLQNELRDADDPSAVISNAALHQNDPVCTETIQLFAKYLAVEAASLVLKLKSTGGCYLGGGIAPKILPFLQSGTWYQEFIAVGRMEPLLRQVPVYVILNSKAALLGAGYFGAYNM
ncbi:MAG: glucokinase, partial [Bacteroidetes bacterium]